MKSALRERLRALSTDGVDALTELTEYAFTRRDDLAKARDQLFEAKLLKYAAMSLSEFGHRARGTREQPETQSIFDQSNFSVQLPRNVISFLLARMHKDAFGSRPWLSVQPRGTSNQALAGQMQRHGEFKLLEAAWQERARSAMETTLNLGWVPVKTTWREDWDVSERMASILFDPADGELVVAQTGDFVFVDDDTEEEMAEPQEEAAMMLGPDGQPTRPADSWNLDIPSEASPTGRRTFAKDPSIPAPDETNGLHFKEHLIEDKERLYAGLDFSPLHWKDVAWPVNAASMTLNDPGCDFISVTVPMTVEQIRATYDPDDDNLELQEILESLVSSSSEQSESSKPKEEMKEPEVKSSDLRNPTIKVTECYFRRRVLPTGPESRIFQVLLDGVRKTAYVEYLKHISPRAQAPVHLMAVNRVPGRAYGRGFHELFEMASEALDKLLNQILVRNDYHANPAKFINSKADAQIREGGGSIKHGPREWNVLDNKEGGALGNLFHVLALPDMDERTWQVFEFLMQLIQTESGVTNANQGDMTSLPTNTTATGINSALESSSVIHLWHLESIRSGLTPPLRYALELLYFRQSEDEAYELLEGDASALQALAQAQAVIAEGPEETAPSEPAAQPGVMTYAQAKQLANVPLNVEILLSRAKRQELREAAFAAIPKVVEFYAYPPQVQKKVLGLYVQAMRGLDIDNPTQYLPSPEELDAAIAALAKRPPGGGIDQVSLRGNMKYEDLPPSVQRQMERDAGYEPAGDEERAEWNAARQRKGDGPAGKRPQVALPPATPEEEEQPPAAA